MCHSSLEGLLVEPDRSDSQGRSSYRNLQNKTSGPVTATSGFCPNRTFCFVKTKFPYFASFSFPVYPAGVYTS